MHLKKKLTHFINLEPVFKRDALVYFFNSKVHSFRYYFNFIVSIGMIIVGVKYLFLCFLEDTELATSLGSFNIGPMAIQGVIHIGHGASALFMWRDNYKLSKSFLDIYKTKNAVLIEELDIYAKKYLLRSRITYYINHFLFSIFVCFGWGSTLLAPLFTVRDTNNLIKYTIPSCLVSAFVWYFLTRHAFYFHFLESDVPIFVQTRLKRLHHDLSCVAQDEEQVNQGKSLIQIMKKFVKIYEDAHRDNQILSRVFGCIYLFGYILISIIIYLMFSTHSERDRLDYIITFTAFTTVTFCMPTFAARTVDKQVLVNKSEYSL